MRLNSFSGPPSLPGAGPTPSRGCGEALVPRLAPSVAPPGSRGVELESPHLRRLFSLASAALLALGLLPGVAAPVAAAGPCNQNTLPAASTNQMYVEKLIANISGADHFDGVRGDAYIRNLDQCIGTSGQGGTFVLPANVQNDVTGTIFQLGYGEIPNYTSRWYYADGSVDAIVKTSSACPAVNGHRVRFTILRNSSNRPVFSIDDLTAGCGLSWTGVTPWSVAQDHAWWGYESWENASGLGPQVGVDSDVHMAYMGYSTEDGGWAYRSGLSATYGSCETCVKRNHSYSYITGHIGDWVYGNDDFNVHTHR